MASSAFIGFLKACKSGDPARIGALIADQMKNHINWAANGGSHAAYFKSCGGGWSALHEATCTVTADSDQGWSNCTIQADQQVGGRTVRGVLRWTAAFSGGLVAGWKDGVSFLPDGGLDRKVLPARQLGSGSVVLMRRPYQHLLVRTKLRLVPSQYDWSPWRHGVARNNLCPGLDPEDGSRGQTGRVSIESDSNIRHIAGLQSIAAGLVPFDHLDRVRITHNILIWECRLVPQSEVDNGTAAELEEGFTVAPAARLSPEERSRFLFDTREHGLADREQMLAELRARGLHRADGMTDYAFVQQLAARVHDHITYHAGNDMAMNQGPVGYPPESSITTPKGTSQPVYSHLLRCTCVLRWVLIEPQGGVLGDFVNYMGLDTDVAPLASFRDSELLYGEPPAGLSVGDAFAKYDKNKNGVLEGDEIVAMLGEVLGWPTPIPSQQRHVLDEALAVLDKDSNMRISQTELQSALDSGLLVSNSRLFRVGQATGGILLQQSASRPASLLDGSELRVFAMPGPIEERIQEDEKCHIPRATNPLALLANQAYPVAEFIYDKVTVYNVEPKTAQRRDLITDWGDGPDFDLEAHPILLESDQQSGLGPRQQFLKSDLAQVRERYSQPGSEADAKAWAASNGYRWGGSGNYRNKGLYVYPHGTGNKHQGSAWWGAGGSTEDIFRALDYRTLDKSCCRIGQLPKQAISSASNSSSQGGTSEADAKAWAASNGYRWGGSGNYRNKGLYVYPHGTGNKHQGSAWWGAGGSTEDIFRALDYRTLDKSCCRIGQLQA